MGKVQKIEKIEKIPDDGGELLGIWGNIEI